MLRFVREHWRLLVGAFGLSLGLINTVHGIITWDRTEMMLAALLLFLAIAFIEEDDK